MLDQNVAREVLQEAVRTGGDFAEIFMEDRIDHAMGMRSHKLESATTSRTHGAGVRVFSGTNAIYVYTNDTSREGLMNCARQAAAAVRGGKGGADWTPGCTGRKRWAGRSSVERSSCRMTPAEAVPDTNIPAARQKLRTRITRAARNRVR